MCGRFALIGPPAGLTSHFSLVEPPEAFPPRYNIAPTQPILIVAGGRGEWPQAPRPGRSAMLARWGLIPAWAKDPAGVPLLFNARSETAADRAAFRAAFRHRRCLVPASGFYEWRKREAGPSQPHWIRPASGGLMAFAGLMETFLAADGSEIDTAAILTTGAEGPLAAIHERMPVMLTPDRFDPWLDCRTVEPAQARRLLEPCGEALEIVPISMRINAVSNMGPDVQEPLAEERPAPPPPSQGSFGF